MTKHFLLSDKDISNEDWVKLGLFIVLHLFVAYVIRLYTSLEVDTWYQGLAKSAFTPPDFIFGIMWSLLYICIAFSGWLLFINRDKAGAGQASIFFILQLIINWMWPILFFTHKLTLPAAVWLGILIICVFVCMTSLIKINRLACYAFIPYIIWLFFAFYLNLTIWVLN